ncbi:helix-turn-helix transcriptional regulator [Candidatus Rhodobacter oscarellae]|nr:LuxR family transcriptional regulator [Candidatus Rhodobacter lobularis]
MLDYVDAVVSARTMETIWPIHCEAMAKFGFNRIMYGMTRSRNPGALGSREDFLVLTNLEESYAEPFVDKGLYKHAPMMRHVLHNTGAASWAWLSQNASKLTPEEKAVMRFNAEHNVKAGYTISFLQITPRTIAAMALIADESVSQEAVDAMWENRGREILALNNVFHLKVTQLPYTAARKTLTKRQRETFEWVGEGKTTQDIGIIMGLTPATVEKHLRLAREALDVETTAQAVVKASFQNQIFLVDGLDA